MSDYASVAERLRRAATSVSRLERALISDSESYSLRVNLAAKRKLVSQLQVRLQEIAEGSGVDLCDYRLVPRMSDRLALSHISQSLLQYQLVFSQIYDAIKNGRKQRAGVSKEVENASQLQIGYTYAGSFGVLLLAPGKRDFFEGEYDASIAALYQLLEIKNMWEVRDAARTLGEAVIKRFHDWSAANVSGSFDVDLQWVRSDGYRFGRLVPHDDLVRYVSLIESASEEVVSDVVATGVLVGIDVVADTFHLSVPDGETFRGSLGADFPRAVVEVPARYECMMRESVITQYATGKEARKYELIALDRK